MIRDLKSFNLRNIEYAYEILGVSKKATLSEVKQIHELLLDETTDIEEQTLIKQAYHFIKEHYDKIQDIVTPNYEYESKKLAIDLIFVMAFIVIVVFAIIYGTYILRIMI